MLFRSALREFGAAGTTCEQPEPQFRLKPRDLMADRRFRKIESLSSGAKLTALGYRRKGNKAAQCWEAHGLANMKSCHVVMLS